MYSLIKDRPKTERPTFEMPDIDLSKIDLSKLNLSKMDLPKLDLSKKDLPKVDLSKVDVAKAVNDAAIAAGLVRTHRPRWQYALGAGLVAAVLGWAYMNKAAIVEGFNRTATRIGDQIGAMRDEAPEDAIAFRSVPTPAMESGLPFDSVDAAQTDYPEGFGAPSEMAVSSDEIPAFEEASSRA
jgi:hypothetical protein